jgi:hypothetical protein
MPIRRELRNLYPAHWRELSRRVRFERAAGVCQGCGRPMAPPCAACRTGDGSIRHGKHGATDAAVSIAGPTSSKWCGCGRRASCLPPRTWIMIRATTVCATCADGCQRCHLTHDPPHHLAQRRITYLLPRLGRLVSGAVRPIPGRVVGPRLRSGTCATTVGWFAAHPNCDRGRRHRVLNGNG